MVSLKGISDYIEQTVNIIGGVLELDVLIVDSELKIIGDSDLELVSQDQCISKDSILASVMDEKTLKILTSKSENTGCLHCKQRDLCIVEMIIAIPVFFDGSVLGSIGIIANSVSDRDKMISNNDNFLKFIDRMIELIVNKLREEQEFEEISILKKRMEVVLDSIDNFLILVSTQGEILQTNLNFKKLFRKKLPQNISDFLDANMVQHLLEKGEEVKYKEVKIGQKSDFLLSSKPVIIDQKDHGVILTLRSIKDIAEEMNELYTPNMGVQFKDLVGNSKKINEVKERIRQISTSSSTVLIDGETGTGKEVVARLIHNISSRKDHPFVAINCSAIPEELMESEIFGYEEGAFSGAKRGGKLGKFQLADGGTIFLDEIGEMALHLQAKLLRVLQDKKVTKIGGLESTQIDIRILAATNRKLEELVEAGMFREDLYYRLNVIPLTIAPLRERKDDINPLINHYIKIYANCIGKAVNGISDDALQVLINHHWRGNVRELRNVIEFSINISNSNMITINHLPKYVLSPGNNALEDLNLDKHMKSLIEKALNKYGHTTQAKEMAAEAMGISVATFYRKIKEYNIQL